MFNKNNNKSTFLTLSIATAIATLSYASNTMADINSKDGVFFYGDNLQVGINKHAAFGSDERSTVIPYSNNHSKLGFISDPSGSQFSSSFDGDFFMPDTTEAGWGIRFDGVDYHNSRNYQYDSGLASIQGLFTNFNRPGSTQEVTWTGDIDNKLGIKQIFSIYQKGLTVVIDVELTNNTTEVMNDVYYMQTVDPDNNYQTSDDPIDLKTTNSIISQGDTAGIAVVSARQPRSGVGSTGESEIKLIGYSKDARVTYGGKTNRKPLDVYTGTAELKNSGSGFIDESISLVTKYDQIAPGDTVKFKLAFQVSNSEIPQITLDSDNSSHAGIANAYKDIFVVGDSSVKVVDSDINITTSSEEDLRGAEILITTPHENDLISLSASLPAGIEVDTTRSSDTKMVLTGDASVADYETALQLVRYSNTDSFPQLQERIINVLILDNIYTLSNAGQALIGVVMPVTIVGKIATDDIVNGQEKTQVSTSGQATPDLSVALVFTDKNGDKITADTPANSQGTWDSSANPIDISTLSDGEITLTATTTDDKGYFSTASKTFEKDTSIGNTVVLSPTANQVLTDTDLAVSGTSEPNANIVVTIDENHSCTTTADADGKWSCDINDLSLDTVYSLEVVATDDAGNEDKAQKSFTTPPLTLDILAPQDKATLANDSPLITGTSLPNSKITATIAGKTCTTTTNSSGSWSCSVTDLPIGDSQELVVTTEAPDKTTKSKTININVPSTPLLISTPQQDVLITSPTINVTGTSDPLAKITVSTGIAEETCTTTANSDGHWSCSFAVKTATPNKTLTIDSELTGLAKKTGTTTIRYEAAAEKPESGVTTVLKGSGSTSPFALLMMLGIFLTRKIFNKKSS